MELDSEDSFLTDISSIFISSQATVAQQSDDAASELTDYCLSEDDAADKQRRRAPRETDNDLYRAPASINISSSEGEVEDADADADPIDCDGSDDGMIDNYPQYLQQRQSSFYTDVFKYNSIHHLKLQPAGVEFLSSTEEGRTALQEYRLEGERVRCRTRGVPQRYKSPDVIQLLVDHPQGSLYPIVAKDDELLLKIDMTILFPRRSDHREFTAAEIHHSGMNDVIHDFFHENRLSLNLRQVNILPLHFDAKYFTVLLTLDSSHINRNERPLAILESIIIEYRSTNKGHSQFPKNMQHRRRQHTCQALLSPTVPTELMTTLERAFSRFTRLDLVNKYGALFNGAYSKRALVVESYASRIARCMAEMYLRIDKLRKKCKEDEEEEAFGPDAYPSGQYQDILQTSSDDVEEIKKRTLEIQTELIEHDRREIPKIDFAPSLKTSTYTGRKKRGSGRGVIRRWDGDNPSSSQRRTALHGENSSLPSQLSPASSFASSSYGRRRNRARSESVRFEELPSHSADIIQPSQRSSQRIKERNQPATNGRYAEEADSESNAVSESDSDGIIEVDKNEFEASTCSESLPITPSAERLKAQKTTDVDEDLTTLVQYHDGTKAENEAVPMLLTLLEDLLKGHQNYPEDGIWGMLRGIMEQRQLDGCLDENCYTAIGSILEVVQLKQTKAALEDVQMQEGGQLQMVVQKEEGGSEANSQMPVKCFRKTRREADSDHEQGPAKKRRIGESSQSQDAEKRRGSKGKEKEKEKEEQVNGGLVGEGEKCGIEMVADNENRLGTMMQMNTTDYSQGAKQQEPPVKVSSLVVEQPSSQPSGRLIIDDEGSTSSSANDQEAKQMIVQDQEQVKESKSTSSSQVVLGEEDGVRFWMYNFNGDEASQKRNDRQFAKNDYCVMGSKMSIPAKATHSKNIRSKGTPTNGARFKDSRPFRAGQGESMQDPIKIDDDG